jgi:hypothetical protein
MYFQFILPSTTPDEREMILVHVTCTRGLFNADPALP